MQKRVFTEQERAILRRNRLKNLDIMVRAFLVLKKNGITTLGKLLQYSEEEVSKLRGYSLCRMGKTVLNDLKGQLEKIGLQLKQ